MRGDPTGAQGSGTTSQAMVDILYIRSIFDFTMDTAEIDGAHQSHALFPDQKWSPLGRNCHSKGRLMQRSCASIKEGSICAISSRASPGDGLLLKGWSRSTRRQLFGSRRFRKIISARAGGSPQAPTHEIASIDCDHAPLSIALSSIGGNSYARSRSYHSRAATQS